MSNTVRIANIDQGETIKRQYDVIINYSNDTGAQADVTPTCDKATVLGAISKSTFETVDAHSAGDLTFTLTHTADDNDHTVSALLTVTSSGQSLAQGSVLHVNISDTPGLSLDATKGFSVKGIPAVDPTAKITGTYDKTKGNKVVLLVDHREFDGAKGKSKEKDGRKLVFSDPAKMDDPAPGKWSHPAIDPASTKMYNGDELRAVLTQDGQVKIIVRGMIEN
jgi:hypothetical protein